MTHTFTLARTMAGRPLPPKPCDFLLPTGVTVTFSCDQNQTLAQIRKSLFVEAKKYPLFSLLREPAWYNFQGVTADGSKEEFVDDTRTLKELDLYIPLLKLVERHGDQNEKVFNAEIGNLIGRRLHDFDVMGTEIIDFRRNILPICEEAVAERKKNVRAMAKYYYPPELEETSTLPPNTPQYVVESQQFQVEILFTDVKLSNPKQLSATLNIPITIEPLGIIKQVFQKKYVVATSHESNTEYVLKICGCEEYLLEDCPITKYKVVLSCKVVDSYYLVHCVTIVHSYLLDERNEATNCLEIVF